MPTTEKYVPIRKSSKSSSKTVGVTEPDGAATFKHHRDHDRTNFWDEGFGVNESASRTLLI
jgi:hypothetical protein